MCWDPPRLRSEATGCARPGLIPPALARVTIEVEAQAGRSASRIHRNSAIGNFPKGRCIHASVAPVGSDVWHAARHAVLAARG